MPQDDEEPKGQRVPEPTVRPLRSIPPEMVGPAILKAVELVVLTGLYSTVSQLTLSPVYGSVPAGLYHQRATMAVFLLAWLARGIFLKYLPRTILIWLPVIAFWMPRYQFILFKQSEQLGAFWGPIITEAGTFYPLAMISMYAASEILSKLDLSHYGERVAEAGPAFGSYIVFRAAEKFSSYLLPKLMGGSIIMTRVGLQFVLATFYALLYPSRLLIVAIPPIIFSATQNIHAPLAQTTELLNKTLQHDGYMLLDRNESLTGYISVLENYKDGFRVMRCDHSLLGGEWTHTVHTPDPAAKVAEPIYAVFAMLEAVRLVEASEGAQKSTESERNALAMYVLTAPILADNLLTSIRGLGIGTTPTALISHGVDTTIVEIDPVVYDFAAKYFNLPKNHTVVIENAVSFVNRATAAVPAAYSYDYIIHDVFTGGAEPVDLFTYEFLRDLKKLLKPEGVIAIVSVILLLTPTTKSNHRTRTTPETSPCLQPALSYEPSNRSSRPARSFEKKKNPQKRNPATSPTWSFSARRPPDP
jgi:spermidine synthase